MTGAPLRNRCCIDGCRRSWPFKPGDEGSEFMCRRHWKTIDLRLRATDKRATARARKIIRLVRRHAIRARGDARIDRAWDMAVTAKARTWEACKADATIKAAFGVDGARATKSEAVGLLSTDQGRRA